MAGEFFRRLTEDEQRDFKDIGPYKGKGARVRFQEEIGAIRLKAAKQKIPFFKKAAMDDFDEYYKEAAKKSMRINGYVSAADIKPIKMDWKKYSSPDNIDFIEMVEQRDAHASKKHPFDIFVRAFRYKYVGYGVPGVYNMSVMEEEVFAVKRARAAYENKPELADISPAEKSSELYKDKPKSDSPQSELPLEIDSLDKHLNDEKLKEKYGDRADEAKKLIEAAD